MGRTTKHLILEEFVVFITDKGKMFCSGLGEADDTFEIPEITGVIDIQGQFQRLGVFKKDGSILVLEQQFLVQCKARSLLIPSQREYDIPLPRLIPALLDSGVVQLAFGDYHFHALHSNGRITSYGKEPNSTGSLGLCGIKSQLGSRIRGVRTGFGSNVLLPHGYFTGRSVWFNEAKNRWQAELMAALSAQGDITDEGRLGELSEWVEQRGSDWDEVPEAAELDEGLGSYFALSVAAGGWSSGALVVVNGSMEEAISKHCPPPPLDRLPKIRFSDGSYSTPDGPEYEWKKEPPVFIVRQGNGSVWAVSGWEWDEDGGQRFRQQAG
jgi:SCF-associated factor 1